MIHSQDKASPDWVSRIIHGYENRLREGDADREAVAAGLQKSAGWWLAGELLVLADSLGNAAISDIVRTMLNPSGRYARVTLKQRYAVADALLTVYGTAWAVYATAMGTTQEALKIARDTDG
ncbi:hypothetical protein [Achromobacter sp. 413638]|uniref:hypothetical protein n=1 Tax=Achromobacter sp. 413638 TaxID=3342385 RepID=UPI00370BC0F6